MSIAEKELWEFSEHSMFWVNIKTVNQCGENEIIIKIFENWWQYFGECCFFCFRFSSGNKIGQFQEVAEFFFNFFNHQNTLNETFQIWIQINCMPKAIKMLELKRLDVVCPLHFQWPPKSSTHLTENVVPWLGKVLTHFKKFGYI